MQTTGSFGRSWSIRMDEPQTESARPAPEWSLPDRLRLPANSRVLDFLRDARPSAHSDVAEVLVRAARCVDGVRCCCPDPARYAYVVAYRPDARIIGLAFGLSGIAFRLPSHRVRAALLAGGTPELELGSEWVRFAPWVEGESGAETLGRLVDWCRIAAGTDGLPGRPTAMNGRLEGDG